MAVQMDKLHKRISEAVVRPVQRCTILLQVNVMTMLRLLPLTYWYGISL